MIASASAMIQSISSLQKCQIDAKRLVGHVAAAVNLARQILWRRLRQPGDDAEPGGI